MCGFKQFKMKNIKKQDKKYLYAIIITIIAIALILCLIIYANFFNKKQIRNNSFIDDSFKFNNMSFEPKDIDKNLLLGKWWNASYEEDYYLKYELNNTYIMFNSDGSYTKIYFQALKEGYYKIIKNKIYFYKDIESMEKDYVEYTAYFDIKDGRLFLYIPAYPKVIVYA